MLVLLEKLICSLLLAGSTLMALNIYRRRWRLIRRGYATPRQPAMRSEGWRRVMLYVPGQSYAIENIKNREWTGLQHIFIFWGGIVFGVCFMATFTGDLLGLAQAIHQQILFRFLLFLGDAAGVLILVGLTWGIVRRAVLRPARLGPDFEVTLFSLISAGGYILVLCYLILEGLRLSTGDVGWVGPVSSFAAGLLQEIGGGAAGQKSLFASLWFVQSVVASGFILYIPFSDHQHPAFAPVTIYQGPHEMASGLQPVELDDAYRGVAGAESLNQRQLTELFACTQCGRCQDACPAFATEAPLSPKQIVMSLKKDADLEARTVAPWKIFLKGHHTAGGQMGESIDDADLWSCTSCMACMEVCPVFISPLDKIMDLRRDRVLIKSRMFKEVGNLFRDTETYGDTFGKGKAFREDWALGKDLRVLAPGNSAKILFWVGCQGAFHDRARRISTAIADLLTEFEPDFAILGKSELCCGDPVRRLGNEYLFQQLARENVRQLSNRGFERIVTSCPHCYHVLKNEYAAFGGRFEVIHYTELIMEWIDQGRLSVKNKVSEQTVYQDPCYLARGNSIVKTPRKILSTVSETVPGEVDNAGKKAFCCGGGGGKMWMRETGLEKINEKRVEQLLGGETDRIATACPYCLIMMEDGVKSLGLETVRCHDIAEIVRDGI